LPCLSITPLRLRRLPRRHGNRADQQIHRDPGATEVVLPLGLQCVDGSVELISRFAGDKMQRGQ
jgi:hypothetical protein